eukprot:TRINITY_DN11510_c0_g1_i1.p2 TRINITY_DN11510_c0_g1~~TRINITY_DN11510_c0_g1_i1.p2  ORF type:complete len:253 (+),score=49.36 TRINITY_DN11510_c0_g1_i1:3515-4273(+)
MGSSSSRSHDDEAALEELSALVINLESALRASNVETIGQLQMLEDKVTMLEALVKDVKAKRTAAATSPPKKIKRTQTANESELVQSWLKPISTPVNGDKNATHNAPRERAKTVPAWPGSTEQDMEPYQRYRPSTDKIRYFAPAMEIELVSEDGRFGLSLVGATSTDLNQPDVDRGIFVRALREGSPAGACGKLHVHDRVLKVNNTDVTQASQEQVVGLIQSAGKKVTLTIAPFIKTKKTRKPAGDAAVAIEH